MSEKVQYLHCKSDGSYHFRRNIPLTLAPYFPKVPKEIRKPLKTKCLKTAKINIKVWSFRTEKLFTLIRSGILTDEQLRQLIVKDLDQTPKTFEGEMLIQQPPEEDRGALLSEAAHTQPHRRSVGGGQSGTKDVKDTLSHFCNSFDRAFNHQFFASLS